ncbi:MULTISPECIES: aldo/keto reductase [unclassified Bradyrhizobium]|uniref:aldo/keto reductase n=1 Tax=unclassified Bradyrhizobium TaxID=2631580 RepID=UPI001FFA0CFC|nr:MULTISPECIES: aldo/keto reductase [unclassified Bradyrhizobium]MCK1709647.1 aldo/keto reductase [Bradyrhizobium sp. 143]MCK1731586.1 aldo/keto reductase [Bradyrhizobium sp. 142]
MAVAMVKPFREILPRNMLPLGFGSGALLSKRRTRRDALRLLETAMDCGVTYFDTARMYGAGRAESILGELTAQKRDRLVLASKAGILPQSRALHVRAMGRGIRFLHKVAPNLKYHVPVPSTSIPRFGAFGPVEFRNSVEKSLKELRTDYLDILLLHECTAADLEETDLLHYLHDLKSAGKIRAFGIATGIDETMSILERHAGLLDVVQIPSAIWNMNVRKLPATDGLVITHSSLTSRFDILLNRLLSDERMAAEWQSLTQVDPRDSKKLAHLLLAHALKANSNGIVIFFSSSPANVVANVKSVSSPVIDEKQIAGLNALLARKHVADFFESSFRGLNF